MAKKIVTTIVYDNFETEIIVTDKIPHMTDTVAVFSSGETTKVRPLRYTVKIDIVQEEIQ